MHLHYRTLLIEHNHWVTEVAVCKVNHEFNLARLPYLTEPRHLKPGMQLVRMIFDQLRNAEKDI